LQNKRQLLGLIYDDGLAADSYISECAYALRDQGLDVAGLVQRNTFRRNRAKCDMELEELASRQVFQLSQDRGAFAGGCRLDRQAISLAAALLADRVAEPCDLLIINKFGRTEAEGSGLREVIVRAVERNLPAVIGVPRRNLSAWQDFSGEFSNDYELVNFNILDWARRTIRSGARNIGNLAFA
jgi:nucleoside-triphosphatase THEP1